MGNLVDLSGLNFGRLKVLHRVSKKGDWPIKWKCLCSCGNYKIIDGHSLKFDKTKSCGCLFKEYSHRFGLGKAAFLKLFRVYILQAKRRNLEFSLTEEQFKNITSLPCFYCGNNPYQISENNGKGNFFGNYIYSGIDRVDNSLGYKISNVVPCCGICNQMKMDMRQDDFINKIIEIYKNLNLKII